MDPHDTSRCNPLQLLQCFTLSRTSALRPKKAASVLTPAARGDNMEDTDLDAEIRRDLEALVPARPAAPGPFAPPPDERAGKCTQRWGWALGSAGGATHSLSLSLFSLSLLNSPP